ncbi:hypothetical protein [Actinoallomurus sp. NPDC052274]|uniref:hypothetical protein n=1 Tax=Actinoallomurus sp. NPDC052274 TaxID=3155420 RepID=UPI003447258F
MPISQGSAHPEQRRRSDREGQEEAGARTRNAANPGRRRTSIFLIIALLLAVFDVLSMLAQAGRYGEYEFDVARGVGACSFPLLLAMVVVALVIVGSHRAGARGLIAKGWAIFAMVCAGLAVTGSAIQIVALIGTSGS